MPSIVERVAMLEVKIADLEKRMDLRGNQIFAAVAIMVTISALIATVTFTILELVIKK